MRAVVITKHGPPEVLQVQERPAPSRPLGGEVAIDVGAAGINFADTMARAGKSARLVQAFTADSEHSYLADAEYVAALQALRGWVERGDKPTPAVIAERFDRYAVNGDRPA